MSGADRTFWQDRRVLVTGHMGFKGAWLCYLLARLGATTTGYGKDDRAPLLYSSLAIPRHHGIVGDINDTSRLTDVIATSEPEIIFHLAAQSLVLASYETPLQTFETNILGTARLLQAARSSRSLRAVVVVTSDKVYMNRGWPWPYREDDELGGNDPYSSSKAAAELVTRSMTLSFFDGQARVATARAGNVIGGGDWAENRLLPDAARAFSAKKPLHVRNPSFTRPWQHVLECLAGYLMLAEALAAERAATASAWNFGPKTEEVLAVREVAELAAAHWGDGAEWKLDPQAAEMKSEAAALAIDSSLARSQLGWRSCWPVTEAVARATRWYRGFHRGASAESLMDEDIGAYLAALDRASNPESWSAAAR